MNISRLLIAVLLICLGSNTAFASPLYLTFQLDSTLGAYNINPADYLGKQYVFLIENDPNIQTPKYIDPAGNLYTYSDNGLYDFFYAENVKSNLITGIIDNSNSVFNYNLGTISNMGGQTSWGSLANYGTYNYSTRLTIDTGRTDDGVSVNGFWNNNLRMSLTDALSTSGGIWMLQDVFYSAEGNKVGTFWASLVGVSETNPESVPVPEPTSLLLIAIGLAIGVPLSRRFKQA